MPNLHLTDRQVMLYMTRSQQHDQESAAAMAGGGRCREAKADLLRQWGLTATHIPTGTTD